MGWTSIIFLIVTGAILVSFRGRSANFDNIIILTIYLLHNGVVFFVELRYSFFCIVFFFDEKIT